MSDLKQVQAGSLESSDCLVTVLQDNSQDKYLLEIKSSVDKQFRNSIDQLCRKILDESSDTMPLKNIRIILEDKGALPFAIEARFKTALKRYYKGE